MPTAELFACEILPVCMKYVYGVVLGL